MRTAAVACVLSLLLPLPSLAQTPEKEVRAVITAFQDGFADRNIARVQATVGQDVVSFENGSRREGWQQYRDRRLLPQFAHPAPASHWEIVKIGASADQAWAYTKSVVSTPRRGDATLWTVFALERRGKQWKIVLVDRCSYRTATGGHSRH